MDELCDAVRQARGAPDDPPRDLFGVVVNGAGDAPEADAAEVFLSHVFALTGSIGFALGWSVLLAGTNQPTEAPAEWVVREAMRLWPVAWLFGRTVATEHEVTGVRLRPRAEVVVCTYLVHRHPGHWTEPDSFCPQRWAGPAGTPAYLPFGWGTHSCTGATIATELTERLLKVILTGYQLEVIPHGARYSPGPALAPPAFTVRLTARTVTG